MTNTTCLQSSAQWHLSITPIFNLPWFFSLFWDNGPGSWYWACQSEITKTFLETKGLHHTVFREQNWKPNHWLYCLTNTDLQQRAILNRAWFGDSAPTQCRKSYSTRDTSDCSSDGKYQLYEMHAAMNVNCWSLVVEFYNMCYLALSP